MNDLDFSILKILSTNSRRSDYSIAKELQVTTNTIKNRIKKLMKEGVLLKFETHLSATFLNATHCWLIAELYERKPKEKVIEEIGEIENVSFIMPTTENIIFIAMDFFDSTDLDNSIQRILGTKHIRRIQMYVYSSRHNHRNKKMDVSPLDWKIIKCIRFNSRKRANEIAKECNVSTRTVNRRLKKLFENGVIHHTMSFDPMSSKGTIVYGILVELDSKFSRDKVVGAITHRVDNLFNHFAVVNSPRILLIFFGKRFSDIHFNENIIKAVEGVTFMKTYFTTKVYYFKDWRDKMIEENAEKYGFKLQNLL